MPVFSSETVSRPIGVEEHFATEAYFAGPGRSLRASGFSALDAELLDIGERRIAAMDAAGMDVQVVSLTAPGVEQLDPAEAIAVAREANDVLGAAVLRYPDRLAGFASLPMSAPESAAQELRRMVGEHGFVGAAINGHSRGRYLDDEFFNPVLATAEELDVPLYLHPTIPPPSVVDASYTGNFSAAVSFRLSTAGWGWHHETGLHALRLILGGGFDRFPGLRIMLGHHGELIPYLLPRIERGLPAEITGLRRPIREYLQENFYYTFGGWNWNSMFETVRRFVRPEHILFATDYPFGSMEEAHGFLSYIEVSRGEQEMIAHGNAERLLGL